jgi:ribonuclease J
LEKAADAEPDVVISENTNMTCVEVSSEQEVMKKLDSVVRHTSGLVLANFACADIDRLRSFYETAVKNDRRLVVTLKQAYLMHRLSEDPHLNIPEIDGENLLVFQKKKKRYFRWEQEAMKLGRTISSEEIGDGQSNVILVSSFYDLGELTEIKPSAGSCYILSASEPFNEEMEIDFDRLLNWLEHYGLPQYHVHVSGHITPLRLRESLKMIRGRKIFPVHGTRPQLFSEFMRDLDSKILLPEKENIYEIC